MDKRLKFGLIALGGLVLLAAGLLIFLSPYLAERRAAEPRALPREVTPIGPTQPKISGEVPKPAQSLAPAHAPVPSKAKLRILENRSRTVVERLGSGVSMDGFLGFRDVTEDFTAAGRAGLLAEQVKLQKEHPATGQIYSISTRAASSVATGAFGDATIHVTIEAIQRTETRGTAQSSGKRILLTFAKQPDGSYLIDAMKWEDVAL